MARIPSEINNAKLIISQLIVMDINKSPLKNKLKANKSPIAEN